MNQISCTKIQLDGSNSSVNFEKVSLPQIVCL